MGDTSDNRRIARNTLLLYGRMLLLMLVGLYTSRVYIGTLGEVDYGIYNVVGGLVGMFSIISGTLSAAISRFLTYELGKGDMAKLKAVFCTAVNIQIIFAISIIVLAEIFGLWFLDTQMNIPAERLPAARWVFHFSVLSFSISIISVPYNASIVAHEKMSAFAAISILEAVMKLVIAFLITISPIDRLVFFSILTMAVSILVRIVYGIYCRSHFEECTYSLVLDKPLMKKMFSFAGWNFIGTTSGILRDEGGNILMNIFFGPAVNAARAISQQINSAVLNFTGSFMTALNPQITKSYAARETAQMMRLVFNGARFSYYLMLILALPLMLNMDYILSIWLKEVPDHTAAFGILALVFAMSETLSNPLITAMLATGNIRNYQIVVGGLQLLNVPVSYVLLKAGWAPETVLAVAIVLSQICLAARLVMLRGMIGLDVKAYLKSVYCNVAAVTLVGALPMILLQKYIPSGFLGLIASCAASLLLSGLSVFFVGCSRHERKKILSWTSAFISRLSSKLRTR